jgi:hypothetical protein
MSIENKSPVFHVGEWVEVRSQKEILTTLDKKGQLEGMPFMPQMFNYCGKRFKIYRSAHKTCDTVTLTGGRKLADGVHLEGIRCDGAVYGGCQAGCLIFWKGAWLKRVDSGGELNKLGEKGPAPAGQGCTEADVLAGTRVPDQKPGEPRYVCQVTQLPAATSLLPWWKLSQYVDDYASGNVTLLQICKGAIFTAYYRVVEAGIGAGRPLRWIYDRIQAVRGGIPYPRHTGHLPPGESTPKGQKLNLMPGELVRVKPFKEILATLGPDNRNRGLLFDAEMVPYCGQVHRVHSRINQILDERTGKMIRIKNDCIVLEEVFCRSRYADCRYTPLFCPRAIYSYWREIWLERVSPADGEKEGREAGKGVVRVDIGSEESINSMSNSPLQIQQE